ncbi:hypothetical protein [Pontibacter actiniarum]|uniref:Uncharacterized protein n=1 Tax=Pontibacter actiniarum TaxID=323450 RepID=A0A1X9YR79_9BACT|nr:hypothetical protein [Pontibacter actiniarum]ARS35354.1 hypothetical protein CA264_07825 [Pontibacter actiniarum]
MAAALLFLVIQLPFLLLGFLIWHLILVYRSVNVNPYKFLSFTMLLGTIIHISIIYCFLKDVFSKVQLGQTVNQAVLVLYFPLITLASVAGGYMLSKIRFSPGDEV